MNWQRRRERKAVLLKQASEWIDQKVFKAEDAVNILETVIPSGANVILEGDNQKQATFLAKTLANVDPEKVNRLNMIMPAVTMDEHLTIFEKGIAEEINFAFSGKQSKKISQMLDDRAIKIGAIHTYLELYARCFVDLIPDVCLIAAEKADRHGNLYTGFSTEDTPVLAEAGAFKDAIVIAQANELVSEDSLPRVDIPGDWVDLVVQADEPYGMEPLFTRDPAKIKDKHILMGMMVIKGIYAKHQVRSLNHGVGYNGAAIELLLPTYGENLGLKGKICTNWVLNPHPTMIPAIESGWVESMYPFGGELGMERYTQARRDIFSIGSDGVLRSNRAMAQLAGLYGMDLFLGATLQMDYLGNSSTVVQGRLSGFGGAPNMGHDTRGRRHASDAWNAMVPNPGNSLIRGRKLVVQMLSSRGKYGDYFVPELDAVKIGREAGLSGIPVMIYGEDVSHVVTEQGIAYLYMAQSENERTRLLAAIAQGTALGERVNAADIESLRAQGKVAYPDDLGIDPADATHDLLAARSLEDLVEWSGGLYDIPDVFKK
ncbi:MAG: malonate decarboxylase subunit alpha [Clostridiaceae bacterium]|jgi:malonate decarboxylase alpha subunit|nr:malonate decarboxylase subunit alpha [Clostridiaceae bacterium]